MLPEQVSSRTERFRGGCPQRHCHPAYCPYPSCFSCRSKSFRFDSLRLVSERHKIFRRGFHEWRGATDKYQRVFIRKPRYFAQQISVDSTAITCPSGWLGLGEGIRNLKLSTALEQAGEFVAVDYFLIRARRIQ